jgi:hypothetical protein
MKLKNRLFSALLMTCGFIYGMNDNKNWTVYNTTDKRKQVEIWMGNDTKEMVAIYFYPSSRRFKGTVTKHSDPLRRIPLRKAKIEEYLMQLKVLTRPPQYNIRDM